MSQVVAVTVPAGVMPGGMFMVRAPSGQSMMAQVPYGMMPGQLMYVRLPAPPPVPIVMVTEEAIKKEAPPEEAGKVVEPKAYDPTGLSEAPNPEQLTPCVACCCTICSLYAVWPQCCGIYSKGVCTCVEIESVCCKAGVSERSICVCLKGEIEFIQPGVCLKMTCQECCIDSRCAFPCDDEVPCIISVCGIQCIKEYSCACAFGESIQTKKTSV